MKVLLFVSLAVLGLSDGAAAWSPRPAVTSPNVELALSPDGPAVTELSLQAQPTATTARLTFFVRQTGETPLTSASLLTVSTDLDLDFATAAGGTDLTIPAMGTPVELVVSVSGLSKAVDTRLALYLRAEGGISTTVGVLRVLRSDAPALTVVGDSGTGVSFEQDRAEFSRDVLLKSDTDADVAATVSYTPLQDDSSRQVPLGLSVAGAPLANGATVNVFALSSRMLTLGATLPRATTYRATLTFTYGTDSASRLIVPLTLKRTATTQTVVGEAVDPVHATRDHCFFACSTTDNITSKVVFRETGGQEAGFDVLKVLRTRVDNNGTMVQANDLTAAIELPDGQTGEALIVGPQESAVVTVDLVEVPRAGRYEVLLRGDTPGAPPVDVTVTFLVRDALRYALGLVILGSLLSFALRWWIGNARQSLGLRVRLDGVNQALTKVVEARNTTPADRATVVTQIRVLIARVVGRARQSGSGPEIGAAVDDLLVRVGLLDEWLEVGGLIDEKGTSDDIDKLMLTARDTLTQHAALDHAAQGVISKGLREARFLLEPAAANHRRQELDEILDAQKPPIGFANQLAWDAYRESLKQRLTAAGAPTSTSARNESDLVLRELITDLAQKLLVRVHDNALVAKNGNMADLASQLDALTPQLDAACQAAKDGSLLDALDAYRSAAVSYEALGPAVVAAGMQMGNTPTSSLVLVGERVEVAASPTPTHDTRNVFARKVALWAGDTATFLVVTAVAAYLGVQALYYPDNTWGSGQDWLTAFLWGMGLAQVGGVASEGIKGVWDKFREP